MPYYCAFGICKSDSTVTRPGYDPTVRFYRFPQPCLLLRDNVLNWSDTEEKKHVKDCKKCSLCLKWMVRCKRSDVKFQKVRHVSRNWHVCSKHFQETPSKIDYELHFPSSRPDNGSVQSKRRERANLRQRPASLSHPDQRETPEEYSRRSMILSDGLSPTEPPSLEVPSREDDELTIPADSSFSEGHVILNEATSPTGLHSNAVGLSSSTPLVQSKTTQTSIVSVDNVCWKEKYESLLERCTFLETQLSVKAIVDFETNLRNNDAMCKFYTGLTNAQFTALVSIFDGVNIEYWGTSTENVRDRKLTRRLELIIFFLRLRGGELVQDIAYKFSLSTAFVSRITTTWVLALYKYFNSFRTQMFVSQDVIKKRLPLRFKSKLFKNIRVIIDCAEIRCETPSNFEQQGNCYSQYKAHTTFKVLLGCAPNGALTFMSELYESSISDRSLVENCGLVDLLEEGDLVLADRGFTIRDLTDEKGAVLKIPAFLKGRDRLTPQEGIGTRKIAGNRIFVEHVVGRLKNFRLFQQEVPQSMRHILSEALFVCGCLLNFGDPLVS